MGGRDVTHLHKPVHGEGRALVADRGSAQRLWALDAPHGEILWSASLDQELVYRPVAAGGGVLVTSFAGRAGYFDSRRLARSRDPECRGSFGNEADFKDAEARWTVLEKAQLVGEKMIHSTPYSGQHSHTTRTGSGPSTCPMDRWIRIPRAYPWPGGSPKGRMRACIAGHRAAPGGDYVYNFDRIQ